jgi:hypothetical protein
MRARAFVVQVAMCGLVVAAANWGVHAASRGSVPRQVLRAADREEPATHVFLGNSLIASGVDVRAFAEARPGGRPLNLGLGASSPLEHLILLRKADRHRGTVVVYGYMDRQLTDPVPGGWDDLFGNRAMGYYADLDTLVRHAAGGDPVHAARLRLTARVPFLVERGAVWAKVEVARRRLGGLGLPAAAETRYGRAEDFAALEAEDVAAFAAACRAAAAGRVGFNPPVAELVQLARDRHAGLVVVEMPMTASHRRRFYETPEWAQYRAHVTALVRAAGGGYVDAADWVPDDEFVDPLHLSPAGASRFTRRLSLALPD